MPSVNTGSIALNIFNSISPMPTGVSGLLSTLVDQNRFYVEQFTGDTIGSVFAEKYQLPITNLTTANVLMLMAVQDGGVSHVRVGGMEGVDTENANLNEMAKQYRDIGNAQLIALTKGLKFYKARG